MIPFTLVRSEVARTFGISRIHNIVLQAAATHGLGSACRSTPVAHRAMAQVGHLFLFLAGG
jgi:arginine exporter protein ArgO